MTDIHGDAFGERDVLSSLRVATTFCPLLALSLIGFPAGVLLGWALDIEPLTTFFIGHTGMKPNAALAFLLCGVGVLCVRKKKGLLLGAVASVMVLLIGGVTLLEHALNHSLGIDQLLFQDPSQVLFPGRMAYITAINFYFAGTSLLCLSLPRPKVVIAQLIAIVIALSPLLAIVGYVLGVHVLYGSAQYSPMEIQSGFLFLLFTLTILSCYPASGVMELFWSRTSGGVVARRLIPAAIFVPILLGAIFVRDRFNFGEQALGVAFILICNIILFVVLVWSLAEFLDRAEIEKRFVERLSRRDALTGIYNRGYFDLRLDEEIKRSNRFKSVFSLLLLDIDHFKLINDTKGHLVGDLALVQMAKLLKNSLRDIDILCRFGGEEFAILAVGTTLSQAAELGEKLRSRIAAADFSEVGRMTASMGAAEYPRQANSASSLIGKADIAMYESKTGGRNRVSICQDDVLEVQNEGSLSPHRQS